MTKGNRIVTNDGPTVAKIINELIKSPYKNIVVDDLNFVAQDYYMKNALKQGWDTPKIMGFNMGLIFDAINSIPESKNFIALAHYDTYKDKGGDELIYKYKSTALMTDEYITPEGKFEIVLYGKSSFDDKEKKSIVQFVTNKDGIFPAKSPYGMFSDLYIPNDLGYIIEKVKEYYG